MRYFDLLAPIYDRLMPAADPDLWMELLRLPSAGRLLDSGGGTGRIAAELRGLAGAVVVTDISKGMLRRALRKKGILAVQADAARLPFPDGAFSRVVMADALHHLPRQEGAVDEMFRVLEPGGRLVIEDFDTWRLPVKVLALMEKAVLMGSRFRSPEEICRMLRRSGTEPSVRRGPHFTVWITADKP